MNNLNMTLPQTLTAQPRLSHDGISGIIAETADKAATVTRQLTTVCERMRSTAEEMRSCIDIERLTEISRRHNIGRALGLGAIYAVGGILLLLMLI